jgi:hypothetical protein
MTDERDPKLSQAYRELGREEPPRALDEAILAAAHRAGRAHPAPLLSPGVGPAARRSWHFPVAAAAVIMLAAGVTLHLQLEQPGIEGIEASSERARPSPAAPAVPAPPPPASPAPLGSVAEAAKPAAKPASKPAPKPETPKPDDTMIARAPEPAKVQAAPPQPAREEEMPKLSASEARGASAGSFVPPPPAVASAPASAPSPAPAAVAPAPARKPMAMQRAEEGMRDRADSAERQSMSEALAKRSQDAGETPEKWLERIAELRRAGKHDEADKSLAEFRQRHPGYRIPEAMLERVERR